MDRTQSQERHSFDATGSRVAGIDPMISCASFEIGLQPAARCTFGVLPPCLLRGSVAGSQKYECAKLPITIRLGSANYKAGRNWIPLRIRMASEGSSDDCAVTNFGSVRSFNDSWPG